MTVSENPSVGWVGTGRMGHAMADRLLLAGCSVHVWNRTRAKAEDLTDHGAVVVDTVADLAGRDVVFTMVSADADLEQVVLGDGGLLRQSVVPRILVDSSTVSAATSSLVRAEATARGVAFLAAPVSGNAKVVKAGKLSIAVSGPEDAYREVLPLLAHIGRAVTHVGGDEQARLVKLAHNIFLGVVTQSLAEIVVLAERGGVPRSAFMEFMNGSVMGSLFTGYKSPAIVNLDLKPTFTSELLRKDFDYGLAAGRELGVPLPLAALTHQLVQSTIGRGHGAEDFIALLIEQARSAGYEVEPENITVPDGLTSA
jgi:3-hydroxyisobutyrate dehydrogenase-like beta-hydroxyacid dehydrogenase